MEGAKEARKPHQSDDQKKMTIVTLGNHQQAGAKVTAHPFRVTVRKNVERRK